MSRNSKKKRDAKKKRTKKVATATATKERPSCCPPSGPCESDIGTTVDLGGA